MRISGWLWKFDCWILPSTSVISCPRWLIPSMMPPKAMFSAAAGLMLVIAKGHEVMPPGRELALRIKAAFQPNRASRPEGIVRDVIFARPQQLDRGINALGDPGHFHQVVVLQSPAEAASRAHHVRGDVALVNSECLCHQPSAIDRQSASGPHFQLSSAPWLLAAQG